MSAVPNSERKHVVFIGKRNVGKSSLVNAFLGQDLSIVSNTPGTTTDPVKKSMELHPFGPIVIIDTAGIDDFGELGEKRITKTVKAITSADFAILVLDANSQLSDEEKKLISLLKKLKVEAIAVINKIELGVNKDLLSEIRELGLRSFNVSCHKMLGIEELKESVSKLIPSEKESILVSDLVNQGDTIVLVVPIDLGAPKGRLIMPQVQTIREALDQSTIVVVVKDKELRLALNNLVTKPKLVVTDSQAIMRVAADVPESVPLTTFSILMARYKGELPAFVKGLKRIEELQNGDKVLISEACTHHAQEDDIGRVKIPRWFSQFVKKEIVFDVKSGEDFPQNLLDYKLIIHCGGCTLTRRAMQRRLKEAEYCGVPIVNYGVLISYLHGAIPRVLEPFGEAIAAWESIN